MRIISYNVNGIRSAIKKGFLEWLQTDPADIICLQEIKANKEDIDVAAIAATGYKTYSFSAQKKGYSGVAILTKIEPDSIEYGSNTEQSDMEGRVIRADFKDITLINAYFPSGTSGEIRQSYKYVWLDEFSTHLTKIQKSRKKLIVCGDYNIAHREIDIHNPVSNKNTSGFLPEERAWFDNLLVAGFVDTFRHLNKEPQHYSWWSIRNPNIRLENKGWRIDYINVTKNLEKGIKAAKILSDIKHSDHCPVFTHIQLI